MGPDPNQNGGSSNIANKGENRPDNDQNHPTRNGEGIKLSKKKRNHQGGLKGTNAAACFLDTNESGPNFYDVALLKGGNSGKLEKDHINCGHGSHQILNHQLLESNRPRDRHEKKQKRKCKVPQPGFAAG